MADKVYELVVKIRAEVELGEGIARGLEQLKGLDEKGKQALGPGSATAQGAASLANTQRILSDALTATGAATKGQADKATGLADVYRALRNQTVGGTEVQKAFKSVVDQLDPGVKRALAATKDYGEAMRILGGAFQASGGDAKAFQSASGSILGDLGRQKIAADINALAIASYGKGAVGAFQLVEKAQQNAVDGAGVVVASNKAIASSQQAAAAVQANFIQGSSLLPALFQRQAQAQQASAKAAEDHAAAQSFLAGAVKDSQSLFAQATTTQEKFAQGASLIPGAFDKAAASEREVTSSLGQFARVLDGGTVSTATLRNELGNLNADQLKGILNANGYAERMTRLGQAIGLTSVATKKLAIESADVATKQAQGAFSTKVAEQAQGLLARASQASADAIAAAGKRTQTIFQETGSAIVGLAVRFERFFGLGQSALVNRAATQIVRGGKDIVESFTAVGNVAPKAASGIAATAKSVGALAPELEAAGEAGGATSSAFAAVATSTGGIVVGLGLAVGAVVATTVALKALTQAGLEASRAFDIVAVRAPREALAGLRKQVFDLSGSTGIAFEELADAEGRALLKVGGDAAKANQLLKVAADTALTAFTSPQQAVEQLGDLMRNYGLRIDEVKDASNTLLILQKTAGEDFGQLASALGAAIPVARDLGIDFHELAAAQAGMAASGLSGTQAMYGLRTVLNNIASPTTAIAIKMRQLGVDTSETAFSTKGLVPVLRDMDAALRRDGTSLSQFFGESRKSGPIFSLLGDGGRKAAEALEQMRSGLDQTKGPIENLNTPIRQLRNLMTELENIAPRLGDALLNSFAPSITASSGIVSELNKILELRAKISGQKPPPTIGETLLGGASRGLRVATAGSLPGILLVSPLLEKINERLKKTREGLEAATSSAIKFGDSFDAITGFGEEQGGGLGRKLTGFARGFAKAISDPALTKAVDALAEEQNKLFTDDFLKRQLAFVNGNKASADALADFTAKLAEHGQVQEVVASAARLFATEAERQADAVKRQKTDFLTLSFALRALNADTKTLDAAFALFSQRAGINQAVLNLNEAALRKADSATAALAERIGLAGQASELFQAELRDEYTALAKRNELLSKTPERTGVGGGSLGDLLDEIERVKKAGADVRAAVEGFDQAERSGFDSLQLQYQRTLTLADSVAKRLPFVAAEILRFADRFKREFLDVETFQGGFEARLRSTFRDISSDFKLGAEAADRLIDSYSQAKSALIDFAAARGTTLEALPVTGGGAFNTFAIGDQGKAETNLSNLIVLQRRAEEQAASLHAQALGNITEEERKTLESQARTAENAASEIARVVALTKNLLDSTFRKGFGGGFDEGLHDFLTQTADDFHRGKDAADDFTSTLKSVRDSIKGIQSSKITPLEQMTIDLGKLGVLAARAEEQASQLFNEDDRRRMREAAQTIGETQQALQALADQQAQGFSGGFAEGINDFVVRAKDTFRLGSEAAGEFANASVDAMTTFFQALGTGKNAMKSFAIAILQALEQMIAKMLAFQSVSGFLGLFGFGGPPVQGPTQGGAPLGTRAQGGPVQEGEDYLVGEKGPEIFRPKKSGTIIPHGQSLVALGGHPRRVVQATQGITRIAAAIATPAASLRAEGQARDTATRGITPLVRRAVSAALRIAQALPSIAEAPPAAPRGALRLLPPRNAPSPQPATRQAARPSGAFQAATRLAAGLTLLVAPTALQRQASAFRAPASESVPFATPPTVIPRIDTTTAFASGIVRSVGRALSGGSSFPAQDLRPLGRRTAQAAPAAVSTQAPRQPSRQPSEVGMRLARTAAGARVRANEFITGAVGEQLPGERTGSVTRLLRAAGTSIQKLVGALPSLRATSAPFAPRGTPAQVRPAQRDQAAASAGRDGRRAAPLAAPDAAPTQRQRRAEAQESAISGLTRTVRRAADSAASIARPTPAASQQVKSVAQPAAKAIATTSQRVSEAREITKPKGDGALAVIASPAQSKIGAAFERPSSQGLDRGTISKAVLNQNIPVRARAQEPARAQSAIHVHVGGITLVSQSLDPRTAGDVILAQMPKIQRALAVAIDEGTTSALNDSLRRNGR